MKDIKQENISDLLRNSNTAKFTQGYIVAFQHPLSGQTIFLANCADIESICYSKYPMLPGTRNVKKAKVYPDVETAKNDIYLLRYHHRQFLKVKIFAKLVLHLHAEGIVEINDPQLNYYAINDLIKD